MTFRTPGFSRRLGTGRTRLLLPVLVALAALVVAYLLFTAIWTDVLWYRSVGFSSVFTTQLWARIGLFVGSGLLMALVVGANMVIAYRLRPPYRLPSVEQQGLDRYRTAVHPHRRLIGIAVVTVLALMTGSSMSGQWPVWLAFLNRTKFGQTDPQFDKDISFYVFTYPFVRLVLGFLFATIILSLLVALVVHYLYGGLRLQGPGDKASPPAKVHLSVLVGLFLLLKAVAYWFDRYGLANSERGVVSGAGYTDVNAVLPAKTILAVIAVICAVLFLVNIWRRGMMLPGVGLTLMVVAAILIGGVYPLLIQQFQVRPDELAKERQYLQRTIEATRRAFGVDRTQVASYGARPEADPGRLGSEAEQLTGVRLLDPNVVGETFQQLQQGRNFYRFSDVLDVDRYRIDGQTRDAVVAVRELSGAPAGQQSWVKDRLVYTHGYGFVSGYGERLAANGTPEWVTKDMPVTGALRIDRPQIYFGERSNSYSIVGGRGQQELDYPDDSPAGQKNTTYSGRGGVPVDGFFNRLLFATKFSDRNILLSGAINDGARILYNRTPREMVQRVAPWLTLDGDPYPAVVNGRILWILDGYTISNGYPYSERISLGDATRDTVTDTRSAVARQANDHVNYMRNSIKATVDAYDGTVRLYQWDESDPVARTWMKVFDNTVQPKSSIPPELMEHFRYPQDMFKVQRQVLARYHVTQPDAFYGAQGFWEVPQDPTAQGRKQPPYYLSLKLPGDQAPQFSLTTVFNPRGRPNLAAFMAVDSTPGPNYGRIRILELPRNSLVQGPGQIQNAFEADTAVKDVLFKLRQGGTRTVPGNLLTIPFAGGLLYIEPMYAQAAGGSEQEPYPVLRQVLVAFGDKVAAGTTLDQALAQLFKTEVTPAPGGGTPPPPPGDGDDGDLSGDIRQALADAQRYFKAGQDALAKNPPDWAAYGEAQKGLQDALNRLAQAQQAANQQNQQNRPSTPSPTPTPGTPSPTPTD
ncbi:UPF0182 family membrane protein [Thermomonospora cellulosilytica]|uniref:UPF0182 protein HNR21_006393 n=1 Tax=Thermomonospora cellulosilytica TaxID=1411118 RepID=A0A7W3N4Q2_9ACTN|nr:UPF0182 family protein [Thermomonospora cellulosilytica]MBA9007511.1 uncharacterized membrane protein (UPF0182 family) [Thermomonospora cellulosilytica]